MTEPTTIEKIDAMLKAADRAETYECTVLVKHGDPLHRKQYTDFVLASVNGVRPLLNVAMCLYQDDLEDTNIPHIIEPLWQAFKEARDD